MNRARKRNLITFGSLLLVGVLTLIVGFFVRGYRVNLNDKTFRPTGILSATSIPEGAQVWINGKLKTATDQTITLSPDEYQVEIKKPGFITWKKVITIEKEVVAEANALLFPIAPDLKALSFTGASQPEISPDGTKLVYFVITEEAVNNPVEVESLGSDQELATTTADLSPKKEDSKIGLWFINLAEKPLVRSFQSRSLIKLPATFNFEAVTLHWSPDSRKILMTVAKSEQINDYFLIDTNQSYDFTIPPLIGEGEAKTQQILADWQKQEELSFQQIFVKLPEKMQEILTSQGENLIFSPDETKILYQVRTKISLPEKFITKEVVGSSTQKETRNLKPDSWYVYDRKEDKNFLVSNNKEVEVSWFPTSQHLLLVKEGLSIEIIEYDGHNQATVYSGPFEDNHVFPFPSGKQLLILTSLNKNRPSDLYSISLE